MAEYSLQEHSPDQKNDIPEQVLLLYDGALVEEAEVKRLPKCAGVKAEHVTLIDLIENENVSQYVNVQHDQYAKSIGMFIVCHTYLGNDEATPYILTRGGFTSLYDLGCQVGNHAEHVFLVLCTCHANADIPFQYHNMQAQRCEDSEKRTDAKFYLRRFALETDKVRDGPPVGEYFPKDMTSLPLIEKLLNDWGNKLWMERDSTFERTALFPRHITQDMENLVKQGPQFFTLRALSGLDHYSCEVNGFAWISKEILTNHFPNYKQHENGEIRESTAAFLF